MLKRIVFAILVLWALTDAILTFRDMPNWWSGILGFLGSLLVSLVFIGLVNLAWDWLARKFSGAKSKPVAPG